MAFEEYVSDPAKPVPYVRRPVRSDDADQWRYWLTTDQRHVDGRPDVLTFVTPVLTKPVKIAGEPVVNLFASTSGTDSDWVVKLIDVYPDAVPSQVEMGGYQLAVAMDIFRGRYRDSFEKPSAIGFVGLTPLSCCSKNVNWICERKYSEVLLSNWT